MLLPATGVNAQDKLTIGIVTFSTSDVDTNQMIDTMTGAANSKRWEVENS